MAAGRAARRPRPPWIATEELEFCCGIKTTLNDRYPMRPLVMMNIIKLRRNRKDSSLSVLEQNSPHDMQNGG